MQSRSPTARGRLPLTPREEGTQAFGTWQEFVAQKESGELQQKKEIVLQGSIFETAQRRGARWVGCRRERSSGEAPSPVRRC